MNRFLEGKGAEGAPYSGFADSRTPVVLTASRKDLATPVARFTSGASYVGRTFGLQTAKAHPEKFELKEWPSGFPTQPTN